jgi:hypothetical protein
MANNYKLRQRERGESVGEKAPAMAALLDRMALARYGRSRRGSIREGICLTCGSAVGSGVKLIPVGRAQGSSAEGSEPMLGAIIEILNPRFRDQRSMDEYWISAMCQRCQDEEFAPEGGDV